MRSYRLTVFIEAYIYVIVDLPGLKFAANRGANRVVGDATVAGSVSTAIQFNSIHVLAGYSLLLIMVQITLWS